MRYLLKMKANKSSKEKEFPTTKFKLVQFPNPNESRFTNIEIK